MLKQLSRNLAIVFVFVVFLFVASGCSHTAIRKDAGVDIAGGQKILKAQEKPDTTTKIPEEKPIVKIISGVEVSGINEAQERILGKTDRLFGMNEMLDAVILRDVPVRFIVETLTKMSGYNVIATQSAAEKRIDIFMLDLSLREALESICRLNGLWFKEDMRVITLMTAEEYADEMVIRRNEKTRIFYMRYTNAEDMANIIGAVIGDQVTLRLVHEEVYGHVGAGGSPGGGGGVGGGGGAGGVASVLTEEDKKRLLALGIVERVRDAAALAEKIGKPLPVTITVFGRNNAIIARSLDSALLQEVGRIIEALDTPTNQVLLEVEIFEIDLGDRFESFFELGYRDPAQPDPGGGFFRGEHILGVLRGDGLIAPTLGYVFSNEFIDARIEFFARQGRVEILSTPFIKAANNTEARLFVGIETPIREDVDVTAITVGDVVTTVFEPIVRIEELGTIINIGLFINEDDTITMNINLEVSTISPHITDITVVDPATGETLLFPLDGVDRTTIESIVVVESGQSVALGGLISEEYILEETKVPVLGDIPVIGFFFTDMVEAEVKSEMIIILTPHVITHPAFGEEVSEEFLQRKSSHPEIVD